MNIKPLDDRVVVKFVEEEEKVRGGIVLPDTAKEEKPQKGEVIAIGKGCYEEDKDPEIKVGDMVVFDKFAGTKIKLEDEEYVIVKLEDILAAFSA